MQSLLQDLRYGLRMLLRKPGFAAVYLPGGKPPAEGEVFGNPALAMAFAASTWLSGCKVVGGIFKAGVWIGVVAAVVVLALAVGVVRMLRHHTGPG